MQQFNKCKYSIPFMLQPKENSLDCCKFNPIPCRLCVHCGTFPKVLSDNFYSSMHREIIIFAHSFILKQNTNQATHCLDFHLSIFLKIRYIKPIAIDTHIDCGNNSKCSVRCILKATARSLESVTLSIFC